MQMVEKAEGPFISVDEAHRERDIGMPGEEGQEGSYDSNNKDREAQIQI